jgi:hypothetical protein
VLATNTKTGEVLNFNHVAVSSQAELGRNLRTRNALDSRYIGQTGGRGGNEFGSMHTHILYAKSLSALNTILDIKKDGTEINKSMRPYVGDFRTLIRK